MISTVLVTGATGFIGRHLAEALLLQGHRVRCLLRTTSDPRRLPAGPLETVTADLLTGEGLDAALDGVDRIVHLAGVTQARSRAAYQLHNVTATRRLLEAVRRTAPGLSRFVFLSSQAAAGPSPGERPREETDPLRPLSFYGESKRDAEALLSSFAEVRATVLRPVPVYGPGDRNFFTLIRSIARGVAPILGQRRKRLTFVHVFDLIQAMVRVMGHPRAVGQTYFVTDGRLYTWEETQGALEAAVGRKALGLRVPRAAVWTAAAGADLWSRLSGRMSILNLDRARELLESDWACSGDTLRREVDYAPRFALPEGLAHTVAWAREQGWLR